MKMSEPTLERILDDLRMFGHLHIHSHMDVGPMGYFDYKKAGWKVHYHINLSDGFEIKLTEKRDLEDIIREVYHEATTWLSFFEPDVFKEVVPDGTYRNADEPKPVSQELGCHQ